jgi:hypothetical protein
MSVIVFPVPRRPSRWARVLKRVRYGPKSDPVIRAVIQKPIIHRDIGRRERRPIQGGKR